MIKPNTLLAEARVLFEGANTEARYRTSISRAYFAAFHFLGDRAAQEGFKLRGTGEDHRTLVAFLIDSNDKALAHCGGLLERLRGFRNKADYNLRMIVQKTLAEHALEDALEIMEEALLLGESEDARNA